MTVSVSVNLPDGQRLTFAKIEAVVYGDVVTGLSLEQHTLIVNRDRNVALEWTPEA